MLASVVPGRLDERVRDRIVATRGNPLALLELPQGLSPAQLAGGFGVTSALSLSARIEESFLRHLESFPEDTQRCCWWRRQSRVIQSFCGTPRRSSGLRPGRWHRRGRPVCSRPAAR
jgi:hypothetical protein